MPAPDKIHDAIKKALIKSGWIITDDPYTISFRGRSLFADLGAERPIAAEREGERIAVEIKSLLGSSIVADLKLALGQLDIYSDLIQLQEPARKLYLATSTQGFDRIQRNPITEYVIEHRSIPLIVVDLQEEVIEQWIN